MNKVFFFIACFFFLYGPGVAADTLLIDVINNEPPNSSSGLIRPKRGQTMQQVESQFGAAIKKQGSVGAPPITRWNYDGFSVYFENNIVIHSVIKKPKIKLNQ
ncbi:MAG: hypothetical protein COB62_00655 [Piscirickettsiaceae bacterium]|nr:MAG: hypothetical protein COB62_00655 [Piscirickettsiaceae bacterium]